MSETTRDRLLREAIPAFAARGYAGTSVRRIMAAADVDSGAVHYHFGGKRQLFQAAVLYFQQPINENREKRLDALGDQASAREILEAFLEPTLEVARDSVLGSHWLRLMAWFPAEPGDHWSFVEGTFGDLPARVVDALHRRCPYLTRREVAFRFALFVSMIRGLGSDEKSRKTIGFLDSDQDEMSSALIQFTLAGLRAPATLGDPS